MKKLILKVTPEQHEYLTMLVESKGILLDDLMKGATPKKGGEIERELNMLDSLQTLLDKAVK